ncbi:hypothetical protein HYH03_014762 [Edaphochlamys debaryana]|uniref:Protein kinase domain-containing protein n=1 Tax=Edaphochlamys debaryana TaxID=47281 RepID=A0A835XNG7_9CHLO|nr:hypothetical protein HYH03_014762 [Edaphochlamys debaryana]|eukprot:KAG2486592.1 hypothetical protein HYH03_014762 [Edaphochlamys debaryana]
MGSGAFAAVYRGVFQGADCAVKLLMTDALTDREGLREALVSPQLRHPHVVQTYVARVALLSAEFLAKIEGMEQAPGRSSAPLGPPRWPSNSSDDGLGAPRKARHVRQGWRDVLASIRAAPGRYLIVMVQEVCEVGNLASAISRGMFRPKQAAGLAGRTELLARRVLLRTASELCRGMIHLHSVNVLHGDLKPANVLLAKSRADRRGFTVKLGDFGLSHLLGPQSSKAASSARGTTAYMSPEAFDGAHSRASDVFAFGVLLWEMLSGTRPYEGLTPAQIAIGVALQGLRPTWPVDTWPELCAIGQRCLAEDPAERPSFRDLEADLVELEEGVREESRRLAALAGPGWRYGKPRGNDATASAYNSPSAAPTSAFSGFPSGSSSVHVAHAPSLPHAASGLASAPSAAGATTRAGPPLPMPSWPPAAGAELMGSSQLPSFAAHTPGTCPSKFLSTACGAGPMLATWPITSSPFSHPDPAAAAAATDGSAAGPAAAASPPAMSPLIAPLWALDVAPLVPHQGSGRSTTRSETDAAAVTAADWVQAQEPASPQPHSSEPAPGPSSLTQAAAATDFLGLRPGHAASTFETRGWAPGGAPILPPRPRGSRAASLEDPVGLAPRAHDWSPRLSLDPDLLAAALFSNNGNAHANGRPGTGDCTLRESALLGGSMSSGPASATWQLSSGIHQWAPGGGGGAGSALGSSAAAASAGGSGLAGGGVGGAISATEAAAGMMLGSASHGESSAAAAVASPFAGVGWALRGVPEGFEMATEGNGSD